MRALFRSEKFICKKFTNTELFLLAIVTLCSVSVCYAAFIWFSVRIIKLMW